MQKLLAGSKLGCDTVDFPTHAHSLGEFEARLILTHIAPYDTVVYEAAKGRLLQLIPAESRERLDFEIVVKSGEVRQLTDLNAWLKDKELVIPQERWITRPDS